MRALLRHLFVDEALLKAVALVLALVLFVAVRVDREAATGALVRVVYVLPEDRVLVSDPPSEVRVALRGPWSRVKSLDERDIEAIRVDLTHATSGDLAFTDDLIRVPPGLRLTSITPPSVKLRFEPKESRALPVQPLVEGDPAPGFRVARTIASPREVRVVGAKSVIDAMRRAPTRPLRVSDARETVRGEVALEPPPLHARWEAGTPSTVEVEVEIATSLAERILRGVAIHVTGATRYDARTEPDEADVILRGPSEALQHVPAGVPSLLVDAQVEDARPTGATRKRVTVVGLPPGVAAELRPDTVTLITRRRVGGAR